MKSLDGARCREVKTLAPHPRLSWNGRGGILPVLRIAFPLILANASYSVNLFLDRAMLAHFSHASTAAALTGGLTAFTVSCFFVGTVSYAGSFVSQYVGAKMPHRVGAAVWQAVYLAIIGGGFLALTCLAAPLMFSAFHHEPEVTQLEIRYYRILSATGVIPLLLNAFSCFWSGRGKTFFIMAVSLLVTGLNIPLNYLLIFGGTAFGVTLPGQGIAGAAYATVGAAAIGVLIYALAFLLPFANKKTFRTIRSDFDSELFWRLIKYGAPNGVQLVLDLAAFNIFIVLIGTIGLDVQTASSAAFSMNSLAFTPMLGLGVAVSIMVGQCIGSRDLYHAECAVKSARVMTVGYMAVMAMLFIFYPDPVFRMFNIESPALMDLTRKMLWFIAAYLLFDGFNVLYGSAIKGAGDTRFSMYAGVAMAWVLYALPCLACHWILTRETVLDRLGRDWAGTLDLWLLWCICVFYIMCCGVVFYLRYRTGKWKKMRVIEQPTPRKMPRTDS